MDATPPTPDNATPASKWKRKIVLIFSAALGVLVICSVLFFIYESTSAGRVIWLDGSSFFQRGPVGPLTRFRRKLEASSLVAPIWKYYIGRQPQIQIASYVWKMPSSLEPIMRLAPPTSTNAEGTRVWVLKAAEMKELEKQIKIIYGGTSMSATRIQILNGSIGAVQLGNWTKVAGTNFFNGIAAEITAKVKLSSIKMSVAITQKELHIAIDGSPSTRTNLMLGWQAMLPNEGALVIDEGDKTKSGEYDTWVVISATAVDSKGQVIKLSH